MSIEQVIAEQTAAIKEQTVALGLLTAALLKVTAGTGAADTTFQESEAQPKQEKATRGKKAAPAEAPAATQAAPEPAPQAAAAAPVAQPTIQESLAAQSGLPTGERNKAYFDTYIFPLFKQLAEATLPDHKELKKIVAHFGIDRVTNVPAEHWDELVILGKEALQSVTKAHSVL